VKCWQKAVLGLMCLVIADKWLQLGFIWPETSRKDLNRPRNDWNGHPSASMRLIRGGLQS